jgi:putative ABC transport system permease protein
MVSSLIQDLRYALRTLAKTPAFTAAAVATLALGLGASTAVFSLVRGVLLRSLPYPEPERIVDVRETNLVKGRAAMTASPPNFLDWERQNRVFSSMGAYAETLLALSDGGDPERLEVTLATTGFFSTLATAPLLGRTFSAEEASPGRDRVAVLSHRLWIRRFGGDPSLLGRTIRLDAEPYVVLGVMPPGFRFPEDGADAWIPLAFGREVETQRGAHYLNVVARLRGGVGLDRAAEEMRRLAARLERQYPDTNADYSASVVPLRDRLVGPVRPALLILLGAVGFVALIACANVANLLLIRGVSRRSEIAVRVALGAERGRLVRQLLTESLLLALAGAALGLALAAGAIELILNFGPGDIPRLAEVGIDGGVLAFLVGTTLAATLLFGLAPALQSSRAPIEGLRGVTGGASLQQRARRMRQALVVAEVALALALSAGAGLMLRSLMRLSAVDPGFQSERVLTFELSLPEARYPDDGRVGAFADQLLVRLRALPGVRASGAIFGLPLTGMRFSSSFQVEGAPVAKAHEPSAQVRVASRDYFRVMSIPVIAGRPFGPSDQAGSPPVILATRSAARKFWPNGDALGKRVRFGARPTSTRLQGEIIGIVGDVRDAGLADAPEPLFYACFEQAPVGFFSAVVRTAGSPEGLAAAVRREVGSLDPELPVTALAPLDEVVSRSAARPRFYVLLLSLFAAAALLLAAVGIYGVLAYAVNQRTREIAIRMALGAGAREVQRLVLREGAVLAAAGLAIGLGAALLLTRALGGLLFGIRPTDPATYAGVALLLAAVALTACYFPARRAVRVDPLVVLRME